MTWPPRAAPPPARRRAPARARASASWPLVDRVAYALCWVTGVGLCLIAVGIVLFMLIKGISYLSPSLLVTVARAVAAPEPERRLPATRSSGPSS